MVKIVIRKNHSKKIFNDEKVQLTLFQKEQYYITTPKFEELRKKILRGDFKKIIKDSMKDNKKLLDRLAEDD